MAVPRSHDDPYTHLGRVVVVGPCASGKSTLALGLRQRGYDAYVCGQEHSAVPSLWQHSRPDVVISLTVDISAIRDRRGANWPGWLYQLQKGRLAGAAAAADITIDTTQLDADGLIETAIGRLNRHARGHESVRQKP